MKTIGSNWLSLWVAAICLPSEIPFHSARIIGKILKNDETSWMIICGKIVIIL